MQDMDGALYQLAEARKNHRLVARAFRFEPLGRHWTRNFENLCSSGKDSIVKGKSHQCMLASCSHVACPSAGECEGLVGKLRSMSDLDVTLAQA